MDQDPAMHIQYSKTLLLRFLDIVVGLVEFMLAARVVLRLLGANPGSPFVAWLYQTTGEWLFPFFTAFPTLMFGGRYALELSTLFAMLVYAIFGWALIRLVSFITDTMLQVR